MANAHEPEVDTFMGGLTQDRRAEVERVREAILAIDLDITERVKWNAPSFCIDGDDRVTLRLQPGDRVEVVFHRGAKRRDDADSFHFDDPTGWLVWASPDRGVVTIADAGETAERLPGLAELVRAWMLAPRS